MNGRKELSERYEKAMSLAEKEWEDVSPASRDDRMDSYRGIILLLNKFHNFTEAIGASLSTVLASGDIDIKSHDLKKIHELLHDSLPGLMKTTKVMLPYTIDAEVKFLERKQEAFEYGVDPGQPYMMPKKAPPIIG